ncbi:uncharacterized protein C2orf80 isoform X1 [Xenopus laevis]|uniref:Uncharacterized protein C2orf80 isoform X1 n=2 Tax=Xenopus laevis TaxID=8355 RepID=A0A8J0TY75_XENLA|nr:uncharacterized protein C2orf80 isoform X1 [Xenopus laevis]XP_041432049.1 uncharacterized protein C2orf80 isoform X1 [Xenopus laevis]
MERKRLKKEVGKLLTDYVSTTLREKDFDPKGKTESTFLDDMAHYDLAIGVALQWLSGSKDANTLKKGKITFPVHQHRYPNRMEREAMILSSFAGVLMHSLPVESVFELYGKKSSKGHLQSTTKDHWTQPFNLSLHPFAMLTAPKAAEHAWKHRAKLQKSSHQNAGYTTKLSNSDTHEEENIDTHGEELHLTDDHLETEEEIKDESEITT